MPLEMGEQRRINGRSGFDSAPFLLPTNPTRQVQFSPETTDTIDVAAIVNEILIADCCVVAGEDWESCDACAGARGVNNSPLPMMTH